MAETAQASLASTQAPVSKAPVYEVGFHLVPTVGEEGIPQALEAIRKALTNTLGDIEIIKENFPAKMTLAYMVERPVAGSREKYTQSYFGWIKFALAEDATREGIPVLHTTLTAMPTVLRHLIIETVREDITQAKQRTVFVSDRLEGKTLEKPVAAKETSVEVSDAELDKTLEALTG